MFLTAVFVTKKGKEGGGGLDPQHCSRLPCSKLAKVGLDCSGRSTSRTSGGLGVPRGIIVVR